MIGEIILAISLSLWLTPYPCITPHVYTPAQQYWCSGVLVPYDFVDDCVECWQTKPQVIEDLQDCEQQLLSNPPTQLSPIVIGIGAGVLFSLGVLTGVGVCLSF